MLSNTEHDCKWHDTGPRTHEELLGRGDVTVTSFSFSFFYFTVFHFISFLFISTSVGSLFVLFPPLIRVLSLPFPLFIFLSFPPLLSLSVPFPSFPPFIFPSLPSFLYPSHPSLSSSSLPFFPFPSPSRSSLPSSSFPFSFPPFPSLPLPVPLLPFPSRPACRIVTMLFFIDAQNGYKLQRRGYKSLYFTHDSCPSYLRLPLRARKGWPSDVEWPRVRPVAFHSSF